MRRLVGWSKKAREVAKYKKANNDSPTTRQQGVCVCVRERERLCGRVCSVGGRKGKEREKKSLSFSSLFGLVGEIERKREERKENFYLLAYLLTSYLLPFLSLSLLALLAVPRSLGC